MRAVRLLQLQEKNSNGLRRELNTKTPLVTTNAYSELLLALKIQGERSFSKLDTAFHLQKEIENQRNEEIESQLESIRNYLNDAGLTWQDMGATDVEMYNNRNILRIGTFALDWIKGGDTCQYIVKTILRSEFELESTEKINLPIIHDSTIVSTLLFQEGQRQIADPSHEKMESDLKIVIPAVKARIFESGGDVFVRFRMHYASVTDISPDIIYGREKDAFLNVISINTPFAFSCNEQKIQIFRAPIELYDMALTEGQMVDITQKYAFVGQDIGERKVYVMYSGEFTFKVTRKDLAPYVIQAGDVLRFPVTFSPEGGWKLLMEHNAQYKNAWWSEVAKGGTVNITPGPKTINIQFPIAVGMDIVNTLIPIIGDKDTLQNSGQIDWTTDFERLTSITGQEFGIVLNFQKQSLTNAFTDINSSLVTLRADVAHLRRLVSQFSIVFTKKTNILSWKGIADFMNNGFWGIVNAVATLQGGIDPLGTPLILGLSFAGKTLSQYLINQTLGGDKSSAKTALDARGGVLTTTLSYYLSLHQNETGSDPIGLYMLDQIEEQKNILSGIYEQHYPVEDTMSHAEYWLMPLVPLLSEETSKIISKLHPQPFDTTLMPMHGNVIIRHAYLDGVALKRKCMLVNVGADPEDLKSANISGVALVSITLKENFLHSFEWEQTYQELGGVWQWTMDPPEIQYFKLKKGAYIGQMWPMRIDYIHSKAFYNMMKKYETRYNLLLHNCQNMSQTFMNYVCTGRWPESWRDEKYLNAMTNEVNVLQEVTYTGFSAVKRSYL